MFTKTRFDSLQLPDAIMQGISSLAWECLTEVQRDTIPLARSGRESLDKHEQGLERLLHLEFLFSSAVNRLVVFKDWSSHQPENWRNKLQKR